MCSTGGGVPKRAGTDWWLLVEASREKCRREDNGRRARPSRLYYDVGTRYHHSKVVSCKRWSLQGLWGLSRGRQWSDQRRVWALEHSTEGAKLGLEYEQAPRIGANNWGDASTAQVDETKELGELLSIKYIPF